MTKGLAPMPSLRGLQAFAAIERTGSAAAAARELHVTPSAISHLLRDLERQLGVALFEREGDSRRLTMDGRELAAELEPAFDRIAAATDRLRRVRGVLHITTVSAFADLWLAPRLGRFRAEVGNIDLFIATTTRAVDLEREDVDVAIRWGLGGWPGLAPRLLFRERLVAVAHPSLAQPDTAAAEVARLPRLIARRRREEWTTWAAAVGVPTLAPTAADMELETRGLALRAALAGAGALAIDAGLIGPDRAAGRLVALLDGRCVARPEGYWVLNRASSAHRAASRLFCDWLDKEAAAERAAHAAAAGTGL